MIWIKNDPNFLPLRIRDMFAASPQLEHTYKNGPKMPLFEVMSKDMNMLKDRKKVPVPPISEVSEQTTWMLAVRDQRDRKAFARLYDHFAPRLKGFVMRSGIPAAQAEEVVQDVMLTIWHKAELFDPHRAQVSAWIYQITRNRNIDMIRKERRPVPDELGQEIGTEPDAGQILAVDQEVKQLVQALEALKPTQRDAIEKTYLGELTHQELCTQTGLPLGTIKSRIRLGLEKLRYELKGMR